MDQRIFFEVILLDRGFELELTNFIAFGFYFYKAEVHILLSVNKV